MYKRGARALQGPNADRSHLTQQADWLAHGKMTRGQEDNLAKMGREGGLISNQR